MLSGRRKTIGVFLCKAYVLFDNAVYHALEEEALRLNCNIVVFATVGYFASRNSYDKQERRMFGLAPIEKLDGILVAPDTYELDGFRDELMSAIRERANCPVVAIRHMSEELDCVQTDESAAINSLMKHLLEDHKLRKIRFLAGYEGHLPAVRKHAAFFSAIRRTGRRRWCAPTTTWRPAWRGRR